MLEDEPCSHWPSSLNAAYEKMIGLGHCGVSTRAGGTEVTRSRIIVLNIISWTLGLLIFWGGSVLLNRALGPGVMRSALHFLLLGLVVTMFGGSYGLLGSRMDKPPGGL